MANELMILKAASFAAVKHASQHRKNAGATPYIVHPLRVAEILAEASFFTEVDLLCAAILHDTIEDTDTTAAELTSEFGANVAAIVVEVTDNKALPKADRKRLQIEHAPHLSREAKLVKLADKIANVHDVAFEPPVGWTNQRRREYIEWACAVARGVRGEDDYLDELFVLSAGAAMKAILNVDSNGNA